MGKKSRTKGAVGEREAAKKLSRVLGVDAYRGRQIRGGEDSPDVGGLSEANLHAEVKRDERTISKSLYKALEQASNDSGDNIPFVISRRNYHGWVVCVDLDNLVDFARMVMECVENEQ